MLSATNVLARGFLVVPTDRRSRAGVPVNGLYAVARSVLHVLGWKTPARAVAIVDRQGRAWGEPLLPQLELLPRLLRALGLSVVEAADEPHLVASYTRAAVDAGDDVVIVGMDKRYAQLVTDTVWWYDANKDARYTPEIVRKRFGVEPAASATIMVSPRAREIARTKDAPMPERAAGTTTRVDTSNLVAPSP